MKYELSEIGEIEFSWDFDEEGYQEFLDENGLDKSNDSFMEYVNDFVMFDLEYFDSDTYHHMDFGSMSYSELEDEFGSRVADYVLNSCMSEGSCRIDQDGLYDGGEGESVEDSAMKLLKHGGYYKGCRGFILKNGVVVYTEAEHNMITRLNGVNSKFDFIRMGNIRVLDASLDICQEPTQQQYDVIEKVLASYRGQTFYLDLFGKKGGEHGVMYRHEEPYRVLRDMEAYFNDGTLPRGDSYESRQMRTVMISESQFSRLLSIK